LDVEMSFIDEEDIFSTTEALVVETTRAVLGREVVAPFPRLTFAEALARFGTDKPDLRFAMELTDVSDIAGRSEFQVFRSVLKAGGEVRALLVPGGARFSRQEMDALTAKAQELGAKGLAWYRVKGDALDGPIAKFLAPELQQELIARLSAKPSPLPPLPVGEGKGEGEPGDLILAVADSPKVTRTVLGQLRLELARTLSLIPPAPAEGGPLAFCWVVDFPLFEWDEKTRRWDPSHHPFTSPKEEDIPLLETDPGRALSRAYDLVFNGEEVASGSIRIHDCDLQQRIFKVLQFTEEEIEARFGFFVRALRFGAPPHGGIAPGIERWMMSLFGRESIRDVMAFPKTQSGVCLVTGAPAAVEEAQLRELGLRLRPPQ
jgi:aspartyl-tRNA synthetase